MPLTDGTVLPLPKYTALLLALKAGVPQWLKTLHQINIFMLTSTFVVLASSTFRPNGSPSESQELAIMFAGISCALSLAGVLVVTGLDRVCFNLYVLLETLKDLQNNNNNKDTPGILLRAIQNSEYSGEEHSGTFSSVRRMETHRALVANGLLFAGVLTLMASIAFEVAALLFVLHELRVFLAFIVAGFLAVPFLLGPFLFVHSGAII